MVFYEYFEDNNILKLNGENSKKIMELPLNVRFKCAEKVLGFTNKKGVWKEERSITIYEKECSDDVAEMKLSLEVLEDCIIVSFNAQMRKDTGIDEIELFRKDNLGIKMIDCLNCFAPQPFNFDGINRAFYKYFCDCSMNGYFTPAPLNFSVGNRNGWVSFGLLDLPDSYEYKLTRRLGILVEKPCGKKIIRKGETYTAPRLLITFPKDEYEGIHLFRKKLVDFEMIEGNKAVNRTPEWWKRPFVVTYGDEIMELQHNWFNDDDLDGEEFCQDWLYMWLNRAEKKLGNINFTIIVDALWQYRYTPEAIPDVNRFPEFRKFIDYCHDRGHKVILWTAPLICNTALPFVSLAEKYDMLSEESISGFPQVKKIDFTSSNADKYFADLCIKYFGKGEGCLDADGLKLDFLALLQNPETADYKEPENGIGVKEMYRFHKLLQEAAVKVKPDVLLNASACDPRFENLISMNRLHDIQKVFSEREMRARVSHLACPDLMIDSDGAIMISDWVKKMYISAVLYSTPSLYYIKEFHDSISFPKEDMLALGRLLDLSEKKVTGKCEFISEGNWRLYKNGKVMGATFDGETILIFGEDDFGYLFSWSSDEINIPFYRRKIEVGYSGLTLKNDRLCGKVEAGKVYKIKVIE